MIKALYEIGRRTIRENPHLNFGIWRVEVEPSSHEASLAFRLWWCSRGGELSHYIRGTIPYTAIHGRPEKTVTALMRAKWQAVANYVELSWCA
jgi:hypothetical protein